MKLQWRPCLLHYFVDHPVYVYFITSVSFDWWETTVNLHIYDFYTADRLRNFMIQRDCMFLNWIANVTCYFLFTSLLHFITSLTGTSLTSLIFLLRTFHSTVITWQLNTLLLCTFSWTLYTLLLSTLPLSFLLNLLRILFYFVFPSCFELYLLSVHVLY